MLAEVRELAADIANARQSMLRESQSLAAAQAEFRPSEAEWSITQVIEHLVWAEHSGLNKMMVAMDAHRRGEPVWSGHNENRGKDIDDIIEATWKEREVAPPIAEPKWGGPLSYWLAFFQSNQGTVESVGGEIRETELDEVVFPHFLSGPLTLRQRLQFLRFHIEHHLPQVQRIKESSGYPAEDI